MEFTDVCRAERHTGAMFNQLKQMNMRSKRNKHGQTVVTLSEKERFNADKALNTVCDVVFSLEKSPLTDEQAKALSELAEILDI